MCIYEKDGWVRWDRGWEHEVVTCTHTHTHTHTHTPEYITLELHGHQKLSTGGRALVLITQVLPIRASQIPNFLSLQIHLNFSSHHLTYNNFRSRNDIACYLELYEEGELEHIQKKLG